MKAKDYLIALNMVPGLGSVKIMKLLKYFPSPKQIFEAPCDKLLNINQIGILLAKRIHTIIDSNEFKRELKQIQDLNIKIVTINDSAYPELLKQIYDPPIALYILGDVSNLQMLSVAVVGCRRASFYGLKQAECIAGVLAAKGVCIVSGLARGIDTAAHKGALASGGRTVAVLGSGLNNIYPPENKNLLEKIVEQKGTVISEFSLEMSPQKGNFPRRNRIISGLSRAVVVVEAAKRSGSLITANLALDEGRDVYAVPGTANSFNAQGTNKLIKEGAKLVENAEDILQELNIESCPQK